MSYTDTQISNLSLLPDYNTIRSRSRDKTLTYTLPYSKAFTSSKVPSLLGCWSIARIPGGSDGPVSVFVLETEFLRSRPPGTKLGSAREPSPREPRDEISRQAVLKQLTPDTFASFSHIASEIILPGHAAILNSHDPSEDLEEEYASKCELIRNAFNKVLRVKTKAAFDRTHDLALTVVFTPEKWMKKNKCESEKDLYKTINDLSRTRNATLKWFQNATKLENKEVLRKVEGLGIYWRNADGSLSWVAGDDSLVPEPAGDVSQPESSSSHPSSQAQTGDYRGEGRSGFVGAETTGASAESWELTEGQMQESDELWKELYGI